MAEDWTFKQSQMPRESDMALKNFMAPSGQLLSKIDQALLCDLEWNGTIAWSDMEVVFNSGFRSHVYFRARNDLSQNPALLIRLARRIRQTVDSLPPTHGPQKCLIGIPSAGTQLAQAVSMLSHFKPGRYPYPICFRTMRAALKGHGKDTSHIDKANLGTHSYITVENVVSTADSMIRSFKLLEPEGYPTKVMHHVVFANWGLGGLDALAAAGYRNVHVCYHMLDIIAAYVAEGIWPEERYLEMKRRVMKFNADNCKRPA